MDLSTVTTLRAARSRADLAGLGGSSAPLAGGTWLFSEPQDHLTELVDLTTLGWAPLVVTDAGLELAATATLARVAGLAEELAGRGWPGLALARPCCDSLLGSWKVWGEATVGGNLALAFPAGPMISLLTAWEATCEVWAPDGTERSTAVPELVTGSGTTSLAPGEVLRRVRVDAAVLACPSAFRRTSLAALGRAAAVVTGRRTPAGGLVLAVTAATPRPVVLRFAALPSAGELTAALAGIRDWHDDVHGDPAWRAHVTGVLAAEVRDELVRDELGRDELGRLS